MAAARYQPLCPSHPLHRMQIFVYRRWLVDYHDRPPVRLVTCPAGVAVGDQADPGSMHVRGQRRGRVLAGQGRRRPAVPARPPWPALLLPAAARMVLCAAAPVRWIFARRLAGHSVARIARALNEAGVPCPSSADPGRNLHRTGAGWTLGTVTTILSNPRYTGRQVWNRQRTDRDLTDPADVSLGIRACSGGTCPTGGSSLASRRTRRWSARRISSPPMTSAPPAAPLLAQVRMRRESAGTSWPGCRYAVAAGGGWSRRGPTARPPTGAVTAIPPPAGAARAGET